jgi:outer membrane protein TolC
MTGRGIRGMRGMRARIILTAAAVLLAPVGALTAQSAGTDAAAPAEGGGVTLTVQQAVARARTNQPLIRQALASVEAARARVGQAQSSYYPNVSAAGSYVYVGPDQTFSFGSFGTFALAPVNNWDFHLGLNQVITQFGKRDVQVKMAESGLAMARIGVEQVTTSLSYQAAQVFYTALFLTAQGRALDAQYENLQQHLQVIRIREETGSATRLEELSTQVRMAAMQSQRTEIENQLQKQEIALRQLTGLDPAAEITLSGSFENGAAPVDASAAAEAATKNRAEVKQALEAERAADLNQRLAFASLYPTLSARGSLGYRNGLLPKINDLNLNWSAGLQLNVPIFQGFLWARSVDEAEKKLEAAKENASAVRTSVSTQVLQAFQDLKSARRQVEISAGALEQARQMVDVAKVQYDIGIITNLEYLDAQTALETANVSNISAMYKEVLSEYALRQAAGENLAE